MEPGPPQGRNAMAKGNHRNSSVTDDHKATSLAAANGESVNDRFEREDEEDDEREAPRAEAPRPVVASRGFFDIYKPSQGYYTRVCTAIAAGLMILWAASFVYGKLVLVGSGMAGEYVRVGVTVAIILIGGLLTYRYLALNRRVCDFLIATEGEMKKVNWTSRKEIAGSTKVVIFVVLALGAFLFIVDIGLMLFFSWIGVLRIVPDTFSKLINFAGD
jgi:preprotein translocase SecE subunit